MKELDSSRNSFYTRDFFQKIFDEIFSDETSVDDKADNICLLLNFVDEGHNDFIIEQLNVGREVLKNSMLCDLVEIVIDKFEYFINKTCDIDFLIDCLSDEVNGDLALRYLYRFREPQDMEIINPAIAKYNRQKDYKKRSNSKSIFYLVKFPESILYHFEDRKFSSSSIEDQEIMISRNLSTDSGMFLNVSIREPSSVSNPDIKELIVSDDRTKQKLDSNIVDESFRAMSFVRVSSVLLQNIKFPKTLIINGEQRKIINAEIEDIQNYLSECLSKYFNAEVEVEITEDRFKEDRIFSFKVLNYSEIFNEITKGEVKVALDTLFFPDRLEYEYDDIKLPEIFVYKREEIEVENTSSKDIEFYLSTILSEQLEFPVYFSIIPIYEGEGYQYSITLTTYGSEIFDEGDLIDVFDKLNFQT